MYANPQRPLEPFKNKQECFGLPLMRWTFKKPTDSKISTAQGVSGGRCQEKELLKNRAHLPKTSRKTKCLEVVVQCIFLGVFHPFFSFFMALLLSVSTGRPRTGYVICRAPVKSEDAVQKLEFQYGNGRSTETSNHASEASPVGSPIFFWE